MNEVSEALIHRMRVDDLSARIDPTDDAFCILSRKRGGVTLGAGRVRRDEIEALAAEGRLSGGPKSCWRVAASDLRPGGPPAAGRPASDAADPLLNPRESPLLWLARRRGADGRPLIDPACLRAGERFRADATLAAMSPSVTVNWGRLEEAGSAPAVRDPALASDRTIAARQRVRAAHRHLGAGLGNLVLDVCVFLTPLQEAERRRGWPARTAKVALELGLSRLADHYGFQSEAEGPERAAMRAWAQDDGRASMNAWLT